MMAELDQNESDNFTLVIHLENQEVDTPVPEELTVSDLPNSENNIVVVTTNETAESTTEVTVTTKEAPENTTEVTTKEAAENTTDILRYFVELRLTPNDILKLKTTISGNADDLRITAQELVAKVRRQNKAVCKLYKLYQTELKQIEEMKKECEKVENDLKKEKEQNEKLAYLVDELKKKHRKLLLEPESNYLIQREMEVQRRMENRRVMADPSISKLKDEYNRLKRTNESLEKNLKEKNVELKAKKLELDQFLNVSTSPRGDRSTVKQ